MIKQTFKLFVLLFVVALATSSCGESEGAKCENYATEILDELEELSVTSQAWAADPTNVANCNAYKAALVSYLTEVDVLFTCVPNEIISDWQEQIAEARASIDDIDC